jgi:hypothetical protein
MQGKVTMGGMTDEEIPEKRKRGPKKGSGGRPKSECPMSLVEVACTYGATEVQCIESLRTQGYPMSIPVLQRAIREATGLTFVEYRDQRAENTKLKLIQKAIQMALGGNCTMLIFCLKNLCDWRDKPPEYEKSFRDMSNQELVILAREKLPQLEQAK